MNVLVEIPASGLGPTPKSTLNPKAESRRLVTVPVQSPDSVCTHTRMQVDMPTPTLQQELLGNIFIMESAGGARGFRLVLPLLVPLRDQSFSWTGLVP